MEYIAILQHYLPSCDYYYKKIRVLVLLRATFGGTMLVLVVTTNITIHTAVLLLLPVHC